MPSDLSKTASARIVSGTAELTAYRRSPDQPRFRKSPGRNCPGQNTTSSGGGNFSCMQSILKNLPFGGDNE